MHINIKNIINDNKNNIVFQGYYKYLLNMNNEPEVYLLI